MIKKATLALIFAACMLSVNGSVVGAESDSLVGVWKLVSYVATDAQSGESLFPFGEHPNGYLIYTAGGRMSALLTVGRASAGVGFMVTKREAPSADQRG